MRTDGIKEINYIIHTDVNRYVQYISLETHFVLFKLYKLFLLHWFKFT